MIAEVAKVLGDIDTDEEGHRAANRPWWRSKQAPAPVRPWPIAWRPFHRPRPQASGLRLPPPPSRCRSKLFGKDLPDLMRNSGLNFSFALAKGRGRYMCLSKLDMLLQEGHAQTATAQLFEEEGFKIEVDEASQKLFTSMIEKLAGNKWDGDRDSWPQALEDQGLGAPNHRPQPRTNRHCPNFGQCAFYKAREGMGKVDVIVTNHTWCWPTWRWAAAPYCPIRVTPCMCSTKVITCRTRPSATLLITCAPAFHRLRLAGANRQEPDQTAGATPAAG